MTDIGHGTGWASRGLGPASGTVPAGELPHSSETLHHHPIQPSGSQELRRGGRIPPPAHSLQVERWRPGRPGDTLGHTSSSWGPPAGQRSARLPALAQSRGLGTHPLPELHPSTHG